ncbi:hypothetical protein B0I35DRAFT_108680 [Stachybotrys elegans]|uniref:Uncharacterized protein n=1 Tax=Stachybotrys elegans TaxID=80388 RepID=A0A8K0SKM1_9HYPO|nr:hypothetical protein B0I35DRAFT_108680 [Stachybotrys elegans]
MPLLAGILSLLQLRCRGRNSYITALLFSTSRLISETVPGLALCIAYYVLRFIEAEFRPSIRPLPHLALPLIRGLAFAYASRFGCCLINFRRQHAFKTICPPSYFVEESIRHFPVIRRDRTSPLSK